MTITATFSDGTEAKYTGKRKNLTAAWAVMIDGRAHWVGYNITRDLALKTARKINEGNALWFKEHGNQTSIEILDI